MIEVVVMNPLVASRPVSAINNKKIEIVKVVEIVKKVEMVSAFRSCVFTRPPAFAGEARPTSLRRDSQSVTIWCLFELGLKSE